MFISICVYLYWKYFRFRLWLADKMVNFMLKSDEKLREDLNKEIENTDKVIEKIKSYAIH